jgi:hypothetical protein
MGGAVTGRIKNGRSLLLEEGDMIVLNALDVVQVNFNISILPVSE